jgi:hypothetical protein
MMGFIQAAGNYLAKGVKAGAKGVINTFDDTAKLAKGGRWSGDIDPTEVAERFGKIDDALSFFSHATHLNTTSILDIVEDGVTPGALSFVPHAAHQIGIMKTVGGVRGYADLLKATTPNPLPALREGFDSVQSVFARNATPNRFA